MSTTDVPIRIQEGQERPAALTKPLLARRPWLQLGHANGFVTRHYTAAIDGLPPALAGFRILHLSDLHIRSVWSSAYDELIERTRSLAPDLILVTGDIVHNRPNHYPAMPHAQRLLTHLPSRLGLHAILGNHDNMRVGFELGQAGVSMLCGKRLLIHDRGATLELIGGPGVDRQHLRPEFAKSFPPRQAGTPRIMMIHFPCHYARLAGMQPDLFLCGHTHGGQVCLPTGRPIICHDPSPIHHCHGAHRFGRTHYIVNHGLGFSGFPIRLFCPAEVVLIELRGK